MSVRRWRQRAKAYLRTGDFAPAEENYRRVVDASPNDPDAWFDLGQCRLAGGDLDAAQAAFAEALKRTGRTGDMALRAAAVLARHGAQELAAKYCRQALAHDQDGAPEAWAELGRLLFDRGELEASAQALERAARLDPADAGIAYNLAIALEPQADRDKVAAWLRRCLELEPHFYRAHQRLAHMTRFSDPDDPLIRAMRRLSADPATPAPGREGLDFALAKAYDDCGEFRDAWRHARRANAAKRKRLPAFDQTTYRRTMSEVASFFHADRIAALACEPEDDGPCPVFIVGLPRSGTSLVERLIASHSQAVAGGERLDVPRLISERLQPYPASLASEADRVLPALRRAYQEQTTRLGRGARVVTDKLPGNFFHLGLIRALFPESPIIHCRRNALDICISMYFQDFDTGHPFANDLQELAAYYRGYRWLLRRWRTRLAGPCLEVWYEQLVTRPDALRARLLAHCGLAPEPDREPVPGKVSDTASLWQVREPVHTRSVRRWRHYTNEIGDLPARLRLGETRDNPR